MKIEHAIHRAWCDTTGSTISFMDFSKSLHAERPTEFGCQVDTFRETFLAGMYFQKEHGYSCASNGRSEVMKNLKELKKEKATLMKEMKSKGIRRISCFNGGLDEQSAQYNRKLFAINCEISYQTKGEGVTP